MSISFPLNPTTDQIYTYGTKSWVYNGSRWVTTGSIYAATNTPIVPISVSDTTPGSTLEGSLWVDASTGTLSVYIGSAWVLASAGVLNTSPNSVPGNAIVDGSITSTQISSNITMSGVTTLGAVGNVKVTGGTSGQFLTTDGEGNLSFSSSGNLLANIQAANITGQVANALVAGTVYTNAQPNITTLGTLSSLSLSGIVAEAFTTKSGATGTVEHDMSASSTFYHTSPSANFTANFTNVSTTANRIIVGVIVIAQGATPYMPTTMQIGGTTQTVSWLGGTAPNGSANKYDMISYNMFRIGSSWSVFGSASSFG